MSPRPEPTEVILEDARKENLSIRRDPFGGVEVHSLARGAVERIAREAGWNVRFTTARSSDAFDTWLTIEAWA